MYKLHKHASHEMYLIKTCIYPTTIDAEWYEQDYIRLKEDRKKFKRIYIPDFEFERKENIINLKIECLFGHQLNRERCDKRIREIIYEEFVLVDGDYGIKDYFDSWRQLVINENDMSSNYKNDYAKKVTIHQIKQHFLILLKQ